MSKVKNITKSCRHALKGLKESGIYKKVLAYDLEGCEIFYCITNDGKLHLSGSSDYGLPPLTVMLDAFNQLTDKDISNFKFMQSEKVLYFMEK
ncbi:hypothetical protein [Clostridium tyrobutyricum]|uniref:hypothetical protein n=1 Tax=Clostridium tyrobutyricum TaxID=1519 RepID=UPI0010A9A6FF|nr:hypothetical protein [Clostridium tyrobutyricum]MBV4423462.1 hypothetical protein [Clostridium tyrobutyricum]QCH28518.1 hypothetical protein EZN00_02122 [Clostridium tyrobutyricum]